MSKWDVLLGIHNFNHLKSFLNDAKIGNAKISTYTVEKIHTRQLINIFFSITTHPDTDKICI